MTIKTPCIRFSGAIFAAILVLPFCARAATVTWNGNGDANNSGTWETGTNWSTSAIPGTSDNAQLLDVTGGTRTVTISSGSPQTISKLTITQTTGGAFNLLYVDDDLTISTSGGNSPFAMSATAGQDSIVTTIADGKTLLATNTNSGMNGTAFNGTLNLGAGSTFRLEALGTSSDLIGATFGGPINATGAGAAIVLDAGRFIQNPVFNGAVAVSNPGSTLTLSVLKSGTPDTLAGVGGSVTFSGDDGSGNSVNLAAGTGMVFNLTGSTYNFTNRVNLAAESSPSAGGAITFSALTGGGSSTLITHFNGGLALGAGATANFYSPTVSTNLAGVSSLGTGAVLLISTDNAQGAMNLVNDGTFTMDAATVNLDWAASGSNNPSSTTIGRRFVNTGSWTLKNAATVAFISSTGRPVTGGFGLGGNDENSGTLNVESGSRIGFLTLYNTGTLNLGSSTAGASDATVYAGSPDNTFTSVTVTNGLTAPVPTSVAGTGVINVLGNAWLGRTTDTSGTTTLNNGTASSAGSAITVGDGTVSATLTVSNRAVAINNFAGNTLDIKANAALVLSSTAVYSTPGNVALTNDGTITHAGTLSMQGTFNGTRSVTTSATGAYRINGTAAVLEALPAAAGTQTTNVAAVTFSVAGVLGGSTAHDTLTYTNSTGNSSRDILALTVNGGEITPGDGTNGSGATSIGMLEFANADITLSGTAKLTFDIGGADSSSSFDKILVGGRTFAIGADTGSVLDIWIVNGFGTSTPQSYTLIDATGGSVTGSFTSLLFEGSAVTNEYTVQNLGDRYVVTLAAGLGTPVPEASTYALLMSAGAGLLAVFGRRRRKA